MSTNDAAVSELRVVGGETRTQLYRTAGATRTTRQQQNETFDGGFQKQNHHGTQTGQHFQHAPTGRQKTQAELIFGDRQREEGKLPGCGEPKLQTWRPVGTRFTSSLSFQLSRELSSAQQELKPKNKPDHCLHRCEFGERHSQVNERAPPAETSVETANDLSSSSSERISFPVKRKEDVITLISNVLETTSSSGIAHSFSDGKLGPYDYNCLHTGSQHGSQPRRTGLESLETEKATEDFTRLENQNHLFELSDPTVTMLSSTMVSVLAPHWNGRLRRGKRGMATGDLEDQVNVQGVTYGSSTEANSACEHFRETQSQHSGERGLRDGFQEPLRASFLGTRRKTVDWSTKSGPASVNLDYECKRKVVQSVSVDGPGRLDNRKIGGGVFSPVATTSSAMSSLSLDLNGEGRAPLASHQGELSPSSSTPTTSSRLLSLRRLNSNWRSSPSEKNPVPQLSPTFLNNNEQDRLKCTPYSSAISYKTTETDPTVSPSLSKHRERNVSKDYSDSEDVPISQPSQKTSTFSCPQQTTLTRELEKQQNYRHSNTRTDHMSESSRLSPYDSYAFLKSRSLGRRTTLTSTSWWKQVTQESSSSLGPNNTTNIYDKNKNKTSTPLIAPSNNNIDLPTQNPVDNKRLSSQIPNSRLNNSTVESVYKGNLNIVMKAQGGPHTLTRSNAEDTPDQELDRCLKQQNGFSLNDRETAKPHSLVSVPSMSKFSGAAGQTTLSHAKNVAVTELQNTLLNPKSLNTPTEKNDLTANTQPYTALFIPPSTSSPTTTNVTLSKTTSFTGQAENKFYVNSETPSLKIVSSPLPSTCSKTSSIFNTQPVSSQTGIPSLSPTRSVPHPRSTEFTRTSTSTPLGFERSYTSIPKSSYPKIISTLIPTSHVSFSSKTNYSPVSNSPTISSTTASSHPAPSTPTSPSLLTLPITTALSSSTAAVTSSSLLTPPSTPTLTRATSPETSLPQAENTFSGSLDLSTKKHSHVEGASMRRVKWQDSVDLQHSEATTEQRSEPSQAPTSPLSPSRPLQNVGAPSIFSFLRPGSSTRTTTPLCLPTPKTSSIQVWREGKHQQSLPSDAANKTSREGKRAHSIAIDSPSQFTFDHGRRNTATPKQERTLSEEASPAHFRSTPLSLPAESSSSYKLAYSATPYSTLRSTRSGEAENLAPISPITKQTSSPPKSICTIPLSSHPDQVANITSPNSKLPLSPINLTQPLSPPFQNRADLHKSSKLVISETDKTNNNHCAHRRQDGHNGKMTLVDRRVGFSSLSAPLLTDKALGSSSTRISVIETLVYNISKTETTTSTHNAKPLMQRSANTHVSVETKFSRQPLTAQSSQLKQSPSESSSQESHCPLIGGVDEGCSNRGMKESIEGKSTFVSLESKHESPTLQSPRKGFFALKKSNSTSNSSLSANKEITLSPERARPETEKPNKSLNKMDQVLTRLRQTFSSRRSDDDLLPLPWKWKRPSQTPSVSGSSDISDISDVTVDSNKTLEEGREREREEVERGRNTRLDERDIWTENRYTLRPPVSTGSWVASDQLSTLSDKTTIDNNQSKHSVLEVVQQAKNAFSKEQASESKICSQATHQFEFYKGDRGNYKPTNQSPSHNDPTQCRKSTSSPRSPFSPFSSLSPMSPLLPADVTDDVFYSPKLQRRGESTCSYEPGEGISLVSSRRSRASTGPSCGDQCQDKERLASYSSCADIKYGIEAGRSFSVSSVLSSRPSGPGRISTGSRFMSASDLSDPAIMHGGHLSSSNGRGLDQWPVTSDQTLKYDYRTTGNYQLSSVPSEPGKMRSRSLPRSLTGCLSNWSSEVTTPSPVTPANLKPGHHWSPNLDTCHIALDTEGPPTPPPSPPWSPATRRISKAPNLASPSSPSSPGSPQGCQSSRGHLPSRGYVSSLSAFEESSDSSSDTTTDDEYYLETDEGDDKETEL